MIKATQVHERDTIAELRKAIKNSSDAEQKTRIRAIISLKKGVTKTQAAKDFIVRRKTILYWAATYNKGGTDALKMSKGGRPEGNPIWNTTIFDDLAGEIDKGGKCWSIPLMQDWITRQYKQNIPESTVWYHLSRLKYSYKSARPHPCKGNKKAQDTFKKGV